MTVEFTVPGPPGHKGRPRFRSMGKYVQVYTDHKTKDYEKYVADCWEKTGSHKLTGELWVFVTAFFAPPKSTTKKARAAMAQNYVGYQHKPDADNVGKVVLDALNGKAYDDDNKITLLHIEKIYSEEPRVNVKLVEREAKTCEP